MPQLIQIKRGTGTQPSLAQGEFYLGMGDNPQLVIGNNNGTDIQIALASQITALSSQISNLQETVTQLAENIATLNTTIDSKLTIPEGGTTGQALVKTESGYGWADMSSGGMNGIPLQSEQPQDQQSGDYWFKDLGTTT